MYKVIEIENGTAVMVAAFRDPIVADEVAAMMRDDADPGVLYRVEHTEIYREMQ